MQTKRIGYIDTLRGLCVIWIVWIHTDCPDFLYYPLRLPALFFISGCFFRPYPWYKFWRKKINQLIVPFVFFYILYYLFLISLNYLKYHCVPSEIAYSIWGIFQAYSFNDAFIVNYPLWFILALLVLQLTTYSLAKIIQQKWLILLASIVLSLFGHFFLRTIPTYFMIGRAFPYLFYYAFGAMFGMELLNLENIEKKKVLIVSLTTFITMIVVSHFLDGSFFPVLLKYIELLSATFLLLLFCAFTNKHRMAKWIGFFGKNSLIVFGLHDMYLTIVRIATQAICGDMNDFLGFVNLIIVLLLMWPSILFLNKYLPYFVAKKDLLTIERDGN